MKRFLRVAFEKNWLSKLKEKLVFRNIKRLATVMTHSYESHLFLTPDAEALAAWKKLLAEPDETR